MMGYQLTIHEASQLLRNKKLSSLELTKACLERIRQLEPEGPRPGYRYR